MTSLSTQQINVEKFKYQPLKTQKDIKKLKKQIITIMSDYLDDLLQDFRLKDKELNKKLKKEVLSISITKN
jgi:hypothetical protein